MYKRYLYKKGRKHGPYYYENVKTEDGKIKTVYLGSSAPHEQIRGGKKFTITKSLLILFLVIASLAIIASAYFLFSSHIVGKTASSEGSFSIDSILIKILLKNGEGSSTSIKIMNTAEEQLSFSVTAGHLIDLVTLNGENSEFKLMPGEIKTVEIKFDSQQKEKNIVFSPSVYVGRMIVKATDLNGRTYQQEIPVIVEIETKETLFDVNLDVPAESRTVMQGNNVLVNVKIFNLRGVKAESVNLDYFIKDSDGNTLISERETIAVPKTQLAFTKTVNIPRNLEAKEYVFAASVSFGTSVGTSSYMFSVVKSIENKLSPSEFVKSCYLSATCYATAIILLIFMFFFIICFIFLLYLFKKVEKVEKPKIQKIKEIQKRIEEIKLMRAQQVKPAVIAKKKERVKIKINKTALISVLIIAAIMALYLLQYFFLKNEIAKAVLLGIDGFFDKAAELFCMTPLPGWLSSASNFIDNILAYIAGINLSPFYNSFYSWLKQNGLYVIISIIAIIIITIVALVIKNFIKHKPVKKNPVKKNRIKKR